MLAGIGRVWYRAVSSVWFGLVGLVSEIQVVVSPTAGGGYARCQPYGRRWVRNYFVPSFYVAYP